MPIDQTLASYLEPLNTSQVPTVAIWSDTCALDKAALFLSYLRKQLSVSAQSSALLRAPVLVIVTELLKYQWTFLIRQLLPECLVFSDFESPQSLAWQDFDLIVCTESECLRFRQSLSSQAFSWVVWDLEGSVAGPEMLAVLLGLGRQIGSLILTSAAILACTQIKQIADRHHVAVFCFSLLNHENARSGRLYLLAADKIERAYQAQLEQKIGLELKSHLERLGLHRSRPFLHESLTRLRLMAAHPALSQLSAAREAEHGAKLTFLKQYLRNQANAQERVLVICQFIQSLNLLRSQLKKVDGLSSSCYQLLLLQNLPALAIDQLNRYQQIICFEPWPNQKQPSQDRFVLPAGWSGSISYFLLAGGIEEKMLRFYLRDYSWSELGQSVLRGPARQLKDYELLQWLPVPESCS